METEDEGDESLACEAEESGSMSHRSPQEKAWTYGGMVNSLPCHGRDCGFKSRCVRQIYNPL